MMPSPNNELAKNVNRYVSDVATSFLKFSCFGAIWGCFSPIPVSGSKQALTIAKSGKFVPLSPFSSLASIGYYGGIVGCVAGVQRLICGGVALARGGRNDVFNEIAGVGGVYIYMRTILSSEKRVLWNNRFVGGALVGAVAYANLGP